jgi:hypothetical protein
MRRMERAAKRDTMKRLVFALLLAFTFTPGLLAGDKPKEKKEKKKTQEKMNFDFSYMYDAEELHQYWRDLVRWKRIEGMFGVGSYHIFPARDSGPFRGPPLTIWGQGFGSSLWRDPVTGWPLQ